MREQRYSRNMFRKGKSAVEGGPKKSCGIETEAVAEYEEVGLEVSLVGIHCKEGGLIFARIERRTPVLRPVVTELLVWPPPQWGPRGRRRTKWPNRQHKESSGRKKAEKQGDH